MTTKADEIRPDVSLAMSREDFERWYWPVEELKIFCDLLDVSKAGKKAILRARVAAALSGEPLPKTSSLKRSTVSSFNWAIEALYLHTTITDSITFGRNVRQFFKEEVGPSFVCHSDFMDWVKANPGQTLRDAVEAWKILEARKDDPNFRRDIAECNNYLRYLRDIRDDNPQMSHEQAKQCWDKKKIRPAENGFVVYSLDDLRFLD
ncbi:MAG: DUF6434 domain-containing protein [Pseudomonadota bacterium]